MLRLKPSDIGGELLQHSSEKLRVLKNFVQFATDLNLKQFERCRTKYIWELVPQSSPGRNIVRGPQAFDLYRKQWPADIFHFASEYALADADVVKISIPKTGKLPDTHQICAGTILKPPQPWPARGPPSRTDDFQQFPDFDQI